MRPPELIDLLLYLLQMGTADGQLLSIFEHRHPVADFHNVNDIDNTATVNKDELRRVQFVEYLLQALSDFRSPGA